MDQQAIVAIITLILTTIIFLGIYVVPSFAVIWILYKKAGHPGWNSIVPYYSQWVMGEIAQAKPVVVWIAIGANIFTTFTGSIGLSRYMPVALLDLLVGLTGLVCGIILLVKFIRAYDRPIWFWLIWLFLPIVAVFLVKQASYKYGAASSTGQAGTTFIPPTTFTPSEPATAFPGSDVQQSSTTFPSPTPAAPGEAVTPTFQAPTSSPSSAPVVSAAQPPAPSFPSQPVTPTDVSIPNATAQTSAAAPAAETQPPTLSGDQPTPPPYNGQ